MNSICRIAAVLFLASGTSHRVDANENPNILFGRDSISVEVDFDGHKEICILDTGAPSTIMQANKFFEKYPVKSKTALSSPGSSSVPLKTISIAKINVAGRQKFKRTIDIISADETTQKSNKCILGLDLIRDEILSFNFKENTLEFLDTFPEKLKSQPIKLAKLGHLLFPLTIGKSEYLALWDTGVTAVTLDQKIIDEHSSEFKFFKEFTTGNDRITGKALSYKVYKSSKLKVVGLPAGEMPVSSLSMKDGAFSFVESGAIIGFIMISRYNWVIDLKKLRWSVSEY